MIEAKLFAYGQLKHDDLPPETLQHWQPDFVYGWLWATGTDPIFKLFYDRGEPGPCFGELQDIYVSELPSLDKIEAKAGYFRERTLTNSGTWAWVYVFRGAVPMHAKRVEIWVENNK